MYSSRIRVKKKKNAVFLFENQNVNFTIECKKIKVKSETNVFKIFARIDECRFVIEELHLIKLLVYIMCFFSCEIEDLCMNKIIRPSKPIETQKTPITNHPSTSTTCIMCVYNRHPRLLIYDYYLSKCVMSLFLLGENERLTFSRGILHTLFFYRYLTLWLKSIIKNY